MVPGYFLLSFALQRGHSDCFYSHSLILFSSKVWPQLAMVSGASIISRLIGQMQYEMKSVRYLGVLMSYFYSMVVHYTILSIHKIANHIIYHISYNIDYTKAHSSFNNK